MCGLCHVLGKSLCLRRHSEHAQFVILFDNHFLRILENYNYNCRMHMWSAHNGGSVEAA
jgi:hypothetical protein